MRVRRITVEVHIDLDNVPGTFHHDDLDTVRQIQAIMNRAVPHYRPVVVLQQDSERVVDTDKDALED